MGWVVNSTIRPLYPPGKDPVPIVYEAGWAPGPVWTCAENLAPTGIRSPDRPTRSESIYRLSYPGPRHVIVSVYNYAYEVPVLLVNFESALMCFLSRFFFKKKPSNIKCYEILVG
jgi:hypothetical protein